ncbi:MAG: hypothetical protein JO063_14655, partial [Pseudonocardiales bacterium]|nr:hypothetical protein [Pseudonocardiales bacterium]
SSPSQQAARHEQEVLLAEVLARLPATLIARHRISRHCAIPRAAVWSTWAGHP